MKYNKILAALAATGLSATALVACGTAAGETTTNADGEVVIEFWHATSGAAGETLSDLVSEFNEQHDGEIEVQASYQGSYEDSISKFIASVQTGDLPALMQANDVQTTYMKDAGLHVPAQELAERNGGFDFSALVPAVANYYTFEDTIHSMPAMVSQPAMFVNDGLLAEADVDRSELDTMDGLLDAAEQIHAETGTAGLTFHQSGWYLEETAAALGQEFCTPDNGVSGEAATDFNLDNQELIDTWNRIGELYGTGAIHNPGTDGSAATGASLAEQAAIQLNSSSGVGNIVSGDPAFEWSVAGLPRQTEEAGAVPGGNSLWAIEEGHSEEVQNAAWEFMEYIGSDSSQQRIFEETGYLPTTSGAVSALTDLTPQQQGLMNQLESTPVNTVTAGCHSGALNDARTSYQEAMSEIANGADAEAALLEAKQGADAAIESYNDRAGA